MKILVTGAAGSLGKLLVTSLVKDKSIDVFATDIKQDPFQEKANSERLEYRQFDLRDEVFFHWLEQCNPDIVIHLASILQISNRITREDAYQIDVIATRNIIQKCIHCEVKKIVITSSGAAYGYTPQNKNIITEDRVAKGNEDYFYSAHKAEVEAILAEYRISDPQLKQTVFRPGAILGENFEGPIVNLFKQKIIVGLIGYPGLFNFIWSEDVIDYLIEAATGNIEGEFNIAGDGALSMRDIATRLKKFYLPLPAFLIQLALAIGKPLGVTQYGPEQVNFIKYRPVLSNSKIKKCFKHQPRYSSLEVLDRYIQLMNESN